MLQYITDYQSMQQLYDKIVFSYHGVPNSHVDDVYEDSICSDNNCEDGITELNKFCYKATTYETTKLLAAKLHLDESKYVVSFQSRLTINGLTHLLTRFLKI